VFADIRTDTLNIDEDKIEARITKKTKAILPVHVFGYPCEMPKIAALAKQRGLTVIEDACEAIGASIGGKKAGTFGDCSVFAFYPNKQMTTGEGGMVVTNNDKLADLAVSMRNQGRDEGMGWLAHSRLGYNYRLSDINCALGLAQLRRIDEIIAKRKKVAEVYQQQLSEIDELILPPMGSGVLERSWFVYVVRLKKQFSEQQRNELIKLLRGEGIGCNVYFPAIHLQPFYQRLYGFKRGDFPVTEAISNHTIALPFFNQLKSEMIGRVVVALKKNIKKVKSNG
jgi:perosamine synthetase